MNPSILNAYSPEERLSELDEILAAGLVRLRARQSTPLCRDSGDSLLDCAAHQSGYANVLTDGALE